MGGNGADKKVLLSFLFLFDVILKQFMEQKYYFIYLLASQCSLKKTVACVVA